MTVVYDSECWFCEEGIEKGEESWCTADGKRVHDSGMRVSMRSEGEEKETRRSKQTSKKEEGEAREQKHKRERGGRRGRGRRRRGASVR